MRKARLLLIIVLLSLTILASDAAFAAGKGGHPGRVVVANRASGSISVIDARSDTVLDTFALPAGDNAPEPMYVTYSKRGNRVFVGDRGNDRVVVFDAGDFSVVDTLPTGAGVWHMWSDAHDRQLWVNADIDNVATVIDPQTLTVIATVPMPADLVSQGYMPHDVIVEPRGRLAYVTMVGGPGPTDFLVQFSTATFEEVNRVAVGKDAHVSLTKTNKLIYVPAQNSDVVSIFNRHSLEPVTELDVPGAHGASMSPNGQVFYTTNLPGGGSDGIFAINVRTNRIIGSTDVPFAVPHNVVATKNGKLFLTHSGATSDKVTVYAISAANPIPVLAGEVTVGLNPFGLTYIP